MADGSLLRLIGKCLHVGVLDGEEYIEPDAGTAQGSVLSPLLGNIYLHYVLDLWFEREVKPRLRGQSDAWSAMRTTSSSASSVEDDARRVMEVLGKRMAALRADPPPGQDPPAALPATADRSSRRERPGHLRLPRVHAVLAADPKGRWRMACKTRRARLRRAIQAVYDWCRRHRHQPVKEQHAALTQTLAGPLQLLRRQRQLCRVWPAAREAREAGLVQVAEPSQPADAMHLGEVQGLAPRTFLCRTHGSWSRSGDD